MGQITRKSSLCFLVILGAVAAVAEPGFRDDLETSLKAYFGEILSNETTAAIAAESETKVEDDRWKRSPIYMANLPSYVADKYTGDKKPGAATRSRGQSYGKPEGYEKENPRKDKYVRKGPVTGYKNKKPLKEAEYSPPLKRRRPPYAGPKADKKYEALPTYGGPMAPPAYKGPGTKTRPHQVGYGANKKARPVAGGYGQSKRPKAKYVPSGKDQRKPAPYGPSNKSENYEQRPTYIRSRKPPHKKGPYRPRPQKKNYSGQKCPYSGRCKKIQYRPGYIPSRPLPAYYKPKETEYEEQTPYDKGDAYEPSPYEKPTEMKPTYEPEEKEYEAGNPYGPKPEYKPEYEAGESYQQPEPQYGAEEPKPEYGTVEPYRDQESSYRTPEPAKEYNYDEPPPAQTPYVAQQGSEGGPVDYVTAQQEYEPQPPQESVAYGEPYPSTDTDTYQEQQQPIPDAEYSEPQQQQQQQYETPVQNRPYEETGTGAGYADDPSQSYNQQVQEQDDVETDQYPASGSGYQEPSSVPTEGEGQDPDYGQPAQQQQYDHGSQYGPGPTNYEEQHQPEAPVYDLKNIAKQGPGKGRSGLYYGYNPYRYRAGYYHNPALTTDSLDSSDDSDDSDRRRRNRVSSTTSDSNDDSAADGDSTDVGSYYY